MRLPQASSLEPSTVAVLWSVAVARLLLGGVALAEAHGTVWTQDESALPVLVPAHAYGAAPPAWRSVALAVLVLLVHVALGLASRKDPGWRSLTHRRRLQAQHEGCPELVSPLLATASGVAIALAALGVGLLLEGPAGPAAGTDGTGGGALATGELTSLALIALGLLALGSAAAAGRTLLMTAGAAVTGLTALVSAPSPTAGIGLFFGVLVVGAVAATPYWTRARARLGRLLRRTAPLVRRPGSPRPA